MRESAEICGSDFQNNMTAHCLRAKKVSLLIEACHSDASEILPTGHSDTSKLSWYRNLQGYEAGNSKEIFSIHLQKLKSRTHIEQILGETWSLPFRY